MPESNDAPTDIQRLTFEQTHGEQTLALLERGTIAQEKMVAKSAWSSPLVVAIFAAALGLIGNLALTWWNNRASLQLESKKEQAALLQQALNTNGNSVTSCSNVSLLLTLHLVNDDSDHVLSSCQTFVQHFPAFGSPQQDTVATKPTKPETPMIPSTGGKRAKPSASETATPSGNMETPLEAGTLPGVAAPANSLTQAAREAIERVRNTYDSGSLHKAVVVSDQGHDGIYINQPSVNIALMKATAACQTFAGENDPCRLVLLDGKQIGTWK